MNYAMTNYVIAPLNISIWLTSFLYILFRFYHSTLYKFVVNLILFDFQDIHGSIAYRGFILKMCRNFHIHIALQLA